MGLNNTRLHQIWSEGYWSACVLFFSFFSQKPTYTGMYTVKCMRIFHFLANKHWNTTTTTVYFGTGNNVIKTSVCLSRTALRAVFLSQLLCQVVAKLIFPWWWLISSLTRQGERYFTAVTIKQVFSSFRRQAPRAKQLARHMITTARLLAGGAIVLSVNSTLEQSVGLVVYN